MHDWEEKICPIMSRPTPQVDKDDPPEFYIFCEGNNCQFFVNFDDCFRKYEGCSLVLFPALKAGVLGELY